jgi:serine protease AprX
VSLTLSPLAWRHHVVARFAVIAALLAAVVLPLAWTGSGSAPALLSHTSGSAPAPSLAALAAKTPTKQIEVVVQLNSRVRWDFGPRLFAKYGGTVTRSLHIIRGYGVRMSAGEAQTLGSDPRIETVTLNSVVHQTGTPDPDQLRTSFLQSSRVSKLWNQESAGTGKGVTVAVVDTGIAGDLSDFQTRDGDSRIKANIAISDDATTVSDMVGHGTHVAGLLAGDSTVRPAGDPLRGAYEGAAPDAKLVNVKVSDDHGNTDLLDVIEGIQFVVDQKDTYKIRVLNLSLSEVAAQSYLLDPLDAAVESAWLKGIVVVTAAGNRGTAADAVSYAPGNDPYAITVGAVDDMGTKDTNDDTFASWSSRGVTQDGFAKPDLVAPGAHMVGPLAPGSDFASLCPTCITDGAYFKMGGTSMAAPVVSGIVADLLELHPDWTPNQVKGALVNNLRRTADGRGLEVNAFGADNAGSGQLISNRGLTPNPLVDPVTGDIDYDHATWSHATWSNADPDHATWSHATWSHATWSHATWSHATWSHATWSHATWSDAFGL